MELVGQDKIAALLLVHSSKFSGWRETTDASSFLLKYLGRDENKCHNQCKWNPQKADQVRLKNLKAAILP